MTPEERFTRMENLLNAILERQVTVDVQLETSARQIHQNAQQIQEHTQQLEKTAAGIRDLAVVSGTLIEAQQRTNDQIQQLHRDIDELREEGKAIDARLTILIDITDRLIRRNGQGGPVIE